MNFYLLLGDLCNTITVYCRRIFRNGERRRPHGGIGRLFVGFACCVLENDGVRGHNIKTLRSPQTLSIYAFLWFQKEIQP